MQALAELLPAVAQKQVGKGGFLILRPDSGIFPTLPYVYIIVCLLSNPFRGCHAFPWLLLWCYHVACCGLCDNGGSHTSTHYVCVSVPRAPTHDASHLSPPGAFLMVPCPPFQSPWLLQATVFLSMPVVLCNDRPTAVHKQNSLRTRVPLYWYAEKEEATAMQVILWKLFCLLWRLLRRCLE